ncbi:hypothetical protein ISF_03203 [Cordyceps fumosorosea ARSEF 2679]|uniref:Uncharacterized protein n=1 Tax=Cordyceps fumosorosea (strain ARSEF 2679) TaxID=1081104 RepID=A0A168AJD6_CORFA|nr:hypothetical protein ISF_03203 [Cordyceps fumosorosea ARSEF 2679]OAA68828.1 hypothetical protein ISF_03203 [Cordyceps fumosorosea ARSEF 2679]
MRSQILRFTLPSENTISVGTFDELRAAGALSQYFGSSFSMRKAIPKPRHEITLIIHTPVLDDTIRKSVYKSNADCYKMLGFVGGDWGFATNTTLVQGDTTAGAASTSLPPEDQLLSVFVLGWESIELHEDATKTALFAEELGKLGPHIDESSGAWYVTLRNHKS